MLFLLALATFAFSVAALKIYIKLSSGRYKLTKNLKGKTVLITGPTSGIGKETALALATVGANVHLLCRNVAKGKQVAEELVQSKISDEGTVSVHELDLNSFSSIRKFAEDFLSTETPIHILINNAGIMAEDQTVTEDGIDETMQSNYLGHFLLTNLLLSRIISSSPSRIINVSSMLHIFAQNFNVESLNFKNSKYSAFNAYTCSKLCNILFTTELAKRLHGSGVTVNALHPGAIQSDLFRHQPIRRWFSYGLCIFYPFFKTVAEGCQTTLYLCDSEEVKHVSGYYFADCRPAVSSLSAMDFNLANKLWTESERLVKSYKKD